ncbi:hypothetical protein [Aquabacterium sp.]|uniref:hypothetical protein n=1 Tax=Aquabacterium sp. TaxID=1872578 RepID=UPI0035B315C8
MKYQRGYIGGSDAEWFGAFALIALVLILIGIGVGELLPYLWGFIKPIIHSLTA